MLGGVQVTRVKSTRLESQYKVITFIFHVFAQVGTVTLINQSAHQIIFAAIYDQLQLGKCTYEPVHFVPKYFQYICTTCHIFAEVGIM